MESDTVDIPSCWGVPGMRVELRLLREVLSAHGLHIVSEAERKVLEACAAMTIGMPSCAPRLPAKMGPIPKAGVMAVCVAELARRSGTP